jgi:Fur family zinc uptake transcriptional regulator
MRHCEHSHDAPAGLDGSGLAAALSAAEDRCAAASERLTPARRRALELLLRRGAPSKAYDLIAVFGENGAPAKPPTVYRALEFLTRQGLAHRIESLNAYVACHLGGAAHVAAFLICTCCGDTRELERFETDHAAAAAKAAGYVLDDVVVEARGLCPACADRRAA